MTEATELQTDESELESNDESQNESETEELDQPAEEAPDRLSENEAVARCLRAWHITMENERAKLDEDESESEAKSEANDAFLAAMPPLSGYQNICDFIACVTQAYMWELIGLKRSEHLLAAAKLALSALRLEPKPDDAGTRGDMPSARASRNGGK
jgi:hypothetical protein